MALIYLIDELEIYNVLQLALKLEMKALTDQIFSSANRSGPRNIVDVNILVVRTRSLLALT
jgi:hypothetical protein